MTGPKTNERPGTKAVLKHFHMSAYKARQVLDLIRNKDVVTASEILANTPREAARVSAKVLASAIANAVHNDGQIAEDLFVAAAYADEVAAETTTTTTAEATEAEATDESAGDAEPEATEAEGDADAADEEKN